MHFWWFGERPAEVRTRADRPFLLAKKEPHRARVPGWPAVEPYDGEDELHEEGLLRIRRGAGARGIARRPGIARGGRSLRANRPLPGEILSGPDGEPVCLPCAQPECPCQPGAAAAWSRASPSAIPKAVRSAVPRAFRRARAGPGAPDVGSPSNSGPRHRGSAGPGVGSGYRHDGGRRASGGGWRPIPGLFNGAAAGRRGR